MLKLMLICIKQHLKAIFEVQFTKKLTKTEAELQKSFAYKKACTVTVNKKKYTLQISSICLEIFRNGKIQHYLLLKSFQSNLKNNPHYIFKSHNQLLRKRLSRKRLACILKQLHLISNTICHGLLYLFRLHFASIFFQMH